MKRKLQKAISILLLLAMVLVIPPMAYADSTQNFTNSETYLRTSYSNDNYVELSISGNTLTVSGKLLMDGLTGLMVKCGEQSRKYIDAASGQAFSVRVSLSHSGSLPISIYTQKNRNSTYWSYIWDRIYIEKTSGGYRIMPSLVLDQNLSFARAYVDPDHFRDSSKVPDSVKSLSKQIVGGEMNDYAKIFLLHKWVAENIYYDYDAYRSGRSTFYDSADILANKRSVCEGYANLLRDLILAQGIPCMKAATYSLGVSSSGGSFAVKADSAAVNNSNHAHVEAWVDEHWVIMDATWDSNNTYENGVYNTDAPNGFYYFDITPETLSLDHKYITRANGKLNMRNGAITGADTLPTTPSTPGTPAVNAALSPQKLTVDGKNANCEKYNIGGSNYFKLRDLAYLLNGTGSQFGVGFDAATSTVSFTTGASYTATGTELAAGADNSGTAKPSSQAILIDGVKHGELTVYNIGGSNFFQLRELGNILGFEVGYDPDTNTAIVRSR